MKSLARKSFLVAFCLLVASVSSMASNDKPIKVSQLPQSAQQILKKNFAGKKRCFVQDGDWGV